MSQIQTGAEKVTWNLSCFGYTGADDPKIDADLKRWSAMARTFYERHHGNLKTQLGQALVDLIALQELRSNMTDFLGLKSRQDTGDALVQKKFASVGVTMAQMDAQHLEFFGHEIVALDDDLIEAHAKDDPIVRKYLPYIKLIRKDGPYLLAEEVEKAIKKRAPLGPVAVSQYFEEYMADLRLSWDGEEKDLDVVLTAANNDPDPEVRAHALKVVNDGLSGHFAKYSALNLYLVAAAQKVEDKERGRATPMTARNMHNQLSDASVDALHDAVATVGAEWTKRFYRLKAKLLKIPLLRWSDRNAPMPFEDHSVVPYDDAMTMVLAAYESFSPTLADLIREVIKAEWIDASPSPGKQQGAFSWPGVCPGGVPRAHVLSNYRGASRDVSTLAHELGHGVHQILASRAQGILLNRSGIALAETASVFGEMTAFKFQKEDLIRSGKKIELLALLMDKINNMMNTVVRQIGFSNFERQLHGWDPKMRTWGPVVKRSVAELDEVWLQTLYEHYGQPGEVFIYHNAPHLWAYIPHFRSPFYVYGYAFGEMVTHSLYAKQEAFGERFEPLYLDMLRAGNSKDAVELLKPFGLDPTDPEFWKAGIEISIGAMVREAEALARESRLIS